MTETAKALLAGAVARRDSIRRKLAYGSKAVSLELLAHWQDEVDRLTELMIKMENRP